VPVGRRKATGVATAVRSLPSAMACSADVSRSASIGMGQPAVQQAPVSRQRYAA